jgi:hypothetical protein
LIVVINGEPAVRAFSGESCYDSHRGIIENAESIKEELGNLAKENPRWRFEEEVDRYLEGK